MMFRSFEWPVTWRLLILYVLQILILIPFAMMFIIPIAIGSQLDTLTTSPGAARFVFFIFAVLGFFLMIYLTIRMFLSIGFVLDRVSGPIRALKYSFEATQGNFWRILAVVLIQVVIFFIGLIPLGIGLIWVIPFSLVLYGMMYRNLSVNVRSV